MKYWNLVQSVPCCTASAVLSSDDLPRLTSAVAIGENLACWIGPWELVDISSPSSSPALINCSMSEWYSF